MSQSYETIQINTDGGSRGNPGPAAIGVIARSNLETLFTISQKIGVQTNNVAEYQAVILALTEFEKQNLLCSELSFVLDSELVVRQITGVYKIKQDHLLALKKQIDGQLEELKQKNRFKSVKFSNVLRDKNTDADRLVNAALDSN